MSTHLIRADARALPLADGSVQTCVTSPPYHQLRDYGVDGQLGSEKTPDDYVAAMVEAFREVRRVLRDDGTLWLNLGDSYAAGGKGGGGSYMAERADAAWQKQSTLCGWRSAPRGFKSKDLLNIPHRVVMALQADGWWHRDTIIWAKPNPMPSSVTDRTTTAHEFVFLLTKRARYFYDADAIREPVTSGPSDLRKMAGGLDRINSRYRDAADPLLAGGNGKIGRKRAVGDPVLGRNRRSVWTIPTQPYKGSHFATFPVRLVEPMIRAGTSEKGCCPKCRAPWRRVVERVRPPEPEHRNPEKRLEPHQAGNVHDGNMGFRASKLSGQEMNRWHEANPPATHWLPGCKCHAGDPVPCRVLDPFSGAGTTVMVADRLGREGIGVELKHDYLAMSRTRVEQDRERRKHGRPAKRSRRPKGELTLFGA